MTSRWTGGTCGLHTLEEKRRTLKAQLASDARRKAAAVELAISAITSIQGQRMV